MYNLTLKQAKQAMESNEPHPEHALPTHGSYRTRSNAKPVVTRRTVVQHARQVNMVTPCTYLTGEHTQKVQS